jgi:acetyl esterase/lipase
MSTLTSDSAQEQLDAAYNCVAAVANYPDLAADFRDRGQELYASWPVSKDLTYGRAPRQRFDWIAAGGPDAPSVIFIHGGYWQSCVKEDYAFAMAGAGAAAVVGLKPGVGSKATQPARWK